MVFKYANLFNLSVFFCLGTHFTCSMFELRGFQFELNLIVVHSNDLSLCVAVLSVHGQVKKNIVRNYCICSVCMVPQLPSNKASHPMKTDWLHSSLSFSAWDADNYFLLCCLRASGQPELVHLPLCALGAGTQLTLLHKLYFNSHQRVVH